MEKEKFLDDIFSKILNQFPELENIIIYAKEFYIEDKRDLEIIKKEINIFIEKYVAMEKLINKEIDDEIKKKTIILIGPMGVGKSSISRELSRQTNLEVIPLDAEDKLSKYYDNRNHFDNFKEFEFYLMSSVLTNLDEPKIIDFGAGHSIYENPLMFMEFKKLISQFENVVLLMPSENKEESLKIVNERIKQRGVDDFKLKDNKHFIESNCNYEVATIIEYTNGKTIEQISSEIENKIENKRRNSYE